VAEPPLLYLDQNYVSGIAKRKPGFRELEPVLRTAIAQGAIGIAESAAHRRESAARPDLPLLELLRQLSGGRRLPDEPGAAESNVERRLRRFAAEHFPERVIRASDEVDFEALSIALPRCELIACDAFMADVIRRAGLDRRFGSAVFGGRRPDVLALRDRLAGGFDSSPRRT
jgi:hypothetical protein